MIGSHFNNQCWGNKVDFMFNPDPYNNFDATFELVTCNYQGGMNVPVWRHWWRAHGCCLLWSRLIGPHYTPLLRHLPRRSTCPPYNYPATSHRHQTSAEQHLETGLSNTLLNIGIEKMNKLQIFFRKITRLCEAIETRHHQEYFYVTKPSLVPTTFLNNYSWFSYKSPAFGAWLRCQKISLGREE